VNGCQTIFSDQTSFGTSPKRGKNKVSDLESVCKMNIKKLTDINTLIAFVNKAGLYENSPGLDWNWYFII
jgi:hypothetical protein